MPVEGLISKPVSSLAEIQKNYSDLGTLKQFFYDWGGANSWLFKTINGFHTGAYDHFMLAVTQLGDYHNFPYYITFAAIWALASALGRKAIGRGGAKQYLTTWVGVIAVMAAAFAINTGTMHVLKHYFAYPRPVIALDRQDINVLEPIDAEKNYQSFPSGHAAFITMIVVSLWGGLSPNLRLSGIGIIALVCWSRIALGMHFPADVVGGTLVGLCTALIARGFVYWLLRKLFGLKCT